MIQKQGSHSNYNVERTFELDEKKKKKKKKSDIHNHFEHIIKKHGPVTDNLPVRIYVNKTENMITFKIKTWYYL